jgi:hypothetical protein
LLSSNVSLSLKDEVKNILRTKHKSYIHKDTFNTPEEKEKILIESSIDKILNEHPKSKISTVILNNLINFEEPGSSYLESMINNLIDPGEI